MLAIFMCSTSVCARSVLANLRPSSHEGGMVKETRWDRKSDTWATRAAVKNAQSTRAQDRLGLRAKAAADRHERDAWEREVGLFGEGRSPRRGVLRPIATGAPAATTL